MLGIRNKKWKAFKKLAVAITMAERRGAVVAWGRKVNGVRFDATVVAPYSNAKYLIGIDPQGCQRQSLEKRPLSLLPSQRRQVRILQSLLRHQAFRRTVEI